MNDQQREMYYEWHGLLNRAHENMPFDKMKWMYDAKHGWEEVPRLTLLFGLERQGKLKKEQRQCSCSPIETVPDNHLSCCLGIECRKCEFLLALDEPSKLTPEQRDTAKAWTCVGHILANGGDLAGEGFLVTVDDRMYWDRVYENLAGGPPVCPDITEQP